jgi:two-component system, cell cycle sensor histidine kinase and response regulator CckA
MTRKILEMAGHKVLEAENGKDAELICRNFKEPIHLMLTDVVMPGMSGRTAAEQVKELRPEMNVLYMSGYTEDAIVHHDVLDEEVNFIEKPFTPNALVSKVRNVLDTSITVGKSES